MLPIGIKCNTISIPTQIQRNNKTTERIVEL